MDKSFPNKLTEKSKNYENYELYWYDEDVEVDENYENYEYVEDDAVMKVICDKSYLVTKVI